MKIELPHCAYPLFIGEGIFPRVDELMGLYRYSANKIVVTRRRDCQRLQSVTGLAEKEARYFELPDSASLNDFSHVPKLFDQFPWERIEKEHGGTLLAFGDDSVLHLANAASQCVASPISLILIPSDFWALLHQCVNYQYYLGWKGNPSVLRFSFCPQMVVLDQEFYAAGGNHWFLGITGIFRFYFLNPIKTFARFSERWFGGALQELRPGVEMIEQIIADRVALFSEQPLLPQWEEHFGLRIARTIEAEQKKRIRNRLRALLIWMEMMWSWRIAARLQLCDTSLAESMQGLIRRALQHFGVKENEWQQIQATFLAKLTPHLAESIYLPRELGELQHMSSVDPKIAKKVLLQCSLQ